MPEFDATVIYRPIPSLPPAFYCAGSDGSIWSRNRGGKGGGKLHPWKRLTGRVGKNGYVMVGISWEGVTRQLYVHSLILEAFVCPHPIGMECRHLNNDKLDNRLLNICWGTSAENAADRVRHEVQATGSRHGQAKLTEVDIPVIRARLAAGEQVKIVARDYGMTPMPIRAIRDRKTWRHVP